MQTIVALVEQGVNQFICVCGISFNDENQGNCMIVVPGAHKHSTKILDVVRKAGDANLTTVVRAELATLMQYT